MTLSKLEFGGEAEDRTPMIAVQVQRNPIIRQPQNPLSIYTRSVGNVSSLFIHERPHVIITSGEARNTVLSKRIELLLPALNQVS